jgi:hypothetical protein
VYGADLDRAPARPIASFMTSTFRLGRISGIEIGAHWSWLLVAVLVVWSLADGVFPDTNPGLTDRTYLAMAIVASLLFFASILLHELGHAVQAQREGIAIEGITLSRPVRERSAAHVWAVSTGGAAAFGNALTVTHVSGTNEYRVDFGRNPADCIFSATLAAVQAGPVLEQPHAGRITVSPDGPRVLVRTFGTSGAASEQPFHLAMGC